MGREELNQTNKTSKYVDEVLVNHLFKLAQEKSVVRWTDFPAMTIAVDVGGKATKQPTNQHGPFFTLTKKTNTVCMLARFNVSKWAAWHERTL